jgi:hypothetical protein
MTLLLSSEMEMSGVGASGVMGMVDGLLERLDMAADVGGEEERRRCEAAMVNGGERMEESVQMQNG